MNALYHGFKFSRAYMDELLILTKGDWTNHVEKSELNINRLKGKGLKCHIEKSFFGQTEMKYLGFWVTYDGVKPMNSKIEAITNMKPPTFRK